MFLYPTAVLAEPMFFFKKIFLALGKQMLFLKKMGINVSGYIDSEKGLGDSARGIIKALETGGINYKINNIIVDSNRENSEYSNIFTDQHPFPVNLICVNADQASATINHSLPEGKKYLKGKYNIGYWYWETSVFPEKYINSSNFFHEIWAASDFICNSLAVNIPIPVIKIPPAFEGPKIYGNENIFLNIEPRISDKDFIFLTVFDAASFWFRKNPEAVIDAFKKAFGNKNEVKLIIKVTNQSRSSFYENFLDKISQSSNIYLINQYFSPNLMNNLYKRANAYVSLHRCEGLGITLIKSMMLGKPVIATAYGGNTDFMNSQNSYLVRYNNLYLKEDVGPYEKGTIWANPDIEQAAFFMENIYKNYNKAIEVAKKAESDTLAYFSPDRIAGLIQKRLHVIQKNGIR